MNHSIRINQIENHIEIFVTLKDGDGHQQVTISENDPNFLCYKPLSNLAVVKPLVTIPIEMAKAIQKALSEL